MANDLEQFIKCLRASKLLDRKQIGAIARAIAKARRPPDPTNVAAHLTELGWISNWQASQLLSGPCCFWLKHYKLIQPIGEGTTSQVFLAEHVGLRRQVVIKLLHHDLLEDPQILERFRREIELVAAIRHHNFVMALDAGVIEDRHYFVTEYIPGRDLYAVVAESGPLPVDVASECARQVAIGLQHLASLNLVHRDINPKNLLLTRDGFDGPPVIKIVDLGISRVQDGASITRTGDFVGTPDFIAPEQITDGKEVDCRADIFGLGATLYYLIVGFPPAEGESIIERLNYRLCQPKVDIRTLRPDVPAELSEAVTRMLAVDPDDRYQTPADVVQALTPIAASQFDGETSSMSDASSVLLTYVSAAADLESARPTTQEWTDFGNVLEGQSDRSPSLEQPVFRDRTINTPNQASMPSMLVKYSVLAVLSVFLIASAIVYQMGQSTLVIDVPPSDRDGLEVYIDEKRLWFRDEGPIQFIAPWGEHIIRLVRPKHLNISQKLILNYGESKTYQPNWVLLQPQLLRVPFIENTARNGQQEWANYLRIPARMKNAVGMDFSLIPPGEFLMGTTKEQAAALIATDPTDASWHAAVAREMPPHQVRISATFYMQSTETTLGQFRQFVEKTGYKTEGERDGAGGNAPATGNGSYQQLPEHIWSNRRFTPTDDHPVVFVSWNDAVSFAEWLSSTDAEYDYRLPTEAEWEYCCRAGTDTIWFCGASDANLERYAWYSRNSTGGTLPTGRRQPNAFGLFDLNGNVWEWCSDWSDENYYGQSPQDNPGGPASGSARILRGGSYNYAATRVRSAHRYMHAPTSRYRHFGIRLCAMHQSVDD